MRSPSQRRPKLESISRGVIAGAFASLTVFWLAQLALGRGVPSGRLLVTISTIVLVVSATFLALLGLGALGARSRSSERSLPRYLLTSALMALVPFSGTVLLFRESGESLSFLWGSWSAVLESLPWLVAYTVGVMVLLSTLSREAERWRAKSHA